MIDDGRTYYKANTEGIRQTMMDRITTRRLLAALLAAGGLMAAGCDGGTPLTAPTKGVVELDGMPLSSGTIRFIPKGGRSGHGIIQSDGTFSVSTFEDGDGALIGPNNISVVSWEGSGGDGLHGDPGAAPTKSLIPAEFNKPHSSGLKCEVVEGENNLRVRLSSDGTGTIDAN